MAVEKLKVFSRKETRSGRESGKERKPRQRYFSRTDGWSIGRTDGRDRRTDKQAGERTKGRSRLAGVEKPAGSMTVAWQRRIAHRRIYIHGAGATRRGTARLGAIRLGPLRFGSALGRARHRTRDLLHTRYSLFGRHRADFACFFPLLSTFLHFLHGLSFSRGCLREAIATLYLGI